MIPNGIMPNAIENAARHRELTKRNEELAKRKEDEQSPGVLPNIQWDKRHDGYVARRGAYTSIPAMLFMLLFLAMGVFAMAAFFMFPIRAGLLQGDHFTMWISLPFTWAIAALIGYGVYRIGRSFVLDRLNSPSELILSRWPLRLGDTARVRYRGRSRPNWEVEKIELFLQCCESMDVEINTKSGTESRREEKIVRQDSQGVVSPVADSTGGFRAEWTLRIPDNGPSSLVRKHSSVDWYLAVTAKSRSGSESGWRSAILVVPERAV